MLPPALLLFELFNTFLFLQLLFYYLKVLGYQRIFVCWFLMHHKTDLENVILLCFNVFWIHYNFPFFIMYYIILLFFYQTIYTFYKQHVQ